MLIRAAEVASRGLCDVRLAGGRIARVAPRLEPTPDEAVLDAGGGALLPGLHDHHLHLFALAAARRSVRCGPPQVCDRDGLARALRAARPDAAGWVRGVGYHESVAGELDRDVLDGLRGDAPVRVQHRSGAMWLVNSAGVRALGLDAGGDAPGVERREGRATGRLRRLDGWLRRRLGDAGPPSLTAVGGELAALGVTGLTDATPGNGPRELAVLVAALEKGELPQRIVLMGSAGLPEPPSAWAPRLARGALKLMLDEAALPRLDELVARVEEAHADARPVAMHCVTRTELVLAVAAFAAAGARPGDRIEHAAVAPPEVVAELARLPLAVVTQPHFIRERGDAYVEEVEPRDLPWLYRCRGFLDAGIALGGGTDAPFGEADPWRAMRSAVERASSGGRPLGPQEALAPERALALFTTPPEAPGGPPRSVADGAPADLVLLEVPWQRARRELSSRRVRATWRGGERIHPAPASREATHPRRQRVG